MTFDSICDDWIGSPAVAGFTPGRTTCSDTVRATHPCTPPPNAPPHPFRYPPPLLEPYRRAFILSFIHLCLCSFSPWLPPSLLINHPVHPFNFLLSSRTHPSSSSSVSIQPVRPPVSCRSRLFLVTESMKTTHNSSTPTCSLLNLSIQEEVASSYDLNCFLSSTDL